MRKVRWSHRRNAVISSPGLAAFTMQPILTRAGVLDITTVSKSDLILSGETNPQAIRINSSNSFDAEVIAKYVVNTLKAKKVAFLTQNDVYGNGFQAAVEAEFKKLNFPGQIVTTEKFAFKDTDFRVQLTNLKGLNPDAIIVTNSSNSSGLPAMRSGRSTAKRASASRPSRASVTVISALRRATRMTSRMCRSSSTARIR